VLKGLDKGGTVKELYADIQVVDSFRIDIFTYSKLHRWDKKALQYYLIMKGHYERKAMEKGTREAEREQKYRASLPRLKN